jgi:hypothetical protein
VPIERVFDSSPRPRTSAITPPELSFRIKTQLPIVMKQGTLIDYALSLDGVPVRLAAPASPTGSRLTRSPTRAS